MTREEILKHAKEVYGEQGFEGTAIDRLMQFSGLIEAAIIAKQAKSEPVCWLHTEFGGAKFINFLDQTPGVGWTKQGLYTHPPVAKPGWKLVPIEPTDEMLNAMNCASHVLNDLRSDRAYKAAIAAAPGAEK